MVINNFYPLNCCEKKDVRLLLSSFQLAHQEQKEEDLKEQEKVLKLDFLNKTRIRHHIVEVYQTVRSRLAATIAKHVLSAPISSSSFQIDLWKSLLSGEKYIGAPHAVILSFSFFTFLLFLNYTYNTHKHFAHPIYARFHHQEFA